MPPDNTIRLPLRGPIVPRFWAYVSIRTDDKCWTWAGSYHRDGYGLVIWRGQRWFAHRVAWTLWFGPIPQGLYVCHRCDNPPCCNPNHLFLGTHIDNMMDAIQKGRARRRGIDHHKSKLTEQDVIEIRQRHSQRELHESIARDFPIGRRQVTDICRKAYWKHI